MSFNGRQRVLIWMDAVAKFSLSEINRLLSIADAEVLMSGVNKYRTEIDNALKKGGYERFVNAIDREKVHAYIAALEKCGVDVIVRGSELYPSTLSKIKNPPAILYALGNKHLLKENDTVGVVGSREPSRIGAENTKVFAGELAQSGLTVVSGMALGIDCIAATAALDVGGKTIAVLGSGINVCYPQENLELYNRLKVEGLILSEYGLNESAMPWRFPTRNRIISALSHTLLIPEARIGSGSLITANDALGEGKRVFAIPAAISNPKGAGTNELLKAGKATLATSADDVLSAYGRGLCVNKQDNGLQLENENERKIYYRLKEGDAHFDELVSLTALSPSELSVILTVMEINGAITKLDNNNYGV